MNTVEEGIGGLDKSAELFSPKSNTDRKDFGKY